MPVITDIQPQKRNDSRFSIYVDHQFFCGASNYVVAKYKLEIGKNVEIDTLKNACIEESIEKAKNYVVDYCLGKPEKVIKDKLKEKEYEEEVIDGVIAFLNKYGYINDADYAKRFTHDALLLKKYGKQKISYLLKQKGISNSIIRDSLDNVSFEEEFEVAKNMYDSVYNKYYKKSANKNVLKGKLYAYFYSRGFSSEIVSELLGNMEYED
jgi:regulatory protein